MFAVALLIWHVALADIVINEVQSSNSSTILDEDGESSDWIELYNSGSTNVNLHGWGLSDNPSNPMKWRFPDRSLPPTGHLLVFASGKDRTNTLESARINSPSEIPGLVMWFNADDEGYSHGEAVSVFNDQSGFSNDGTQSEVGNRPSYLTNAVNGHAAFRFNKSLKQHVDLDSTGFNGLVTLRDFSIFVVCKWQGVATSGLFGAWDTSSSSGNTHFEVKSGGDLRLRVGAMNSAYGDNLFQDGVWCQVAGVMRSAGDDPLGSVYGDGSLSGTKAASPGTVTVADYGKMQIGNSYSNTRYFDGDMAEILMFNRALTATEIDQVERYLAERYAMPLNGVPQHPELHTNFGLSSDGESVVLSGALTNLMDQVAVPALLSDTSYGCSPDGVLPAAYFVEPTPGAANNTTAYGTPLPTVEFSQQRGIYEIPFVLALSCADAGADIYYTLDGSEPSGLNGTLYSSAVYVGTTTVVRAASYKAGALPQRSIQTHTYLFLNDVIAQTSKPAGYPADWNGFQDVSYSISSTATAQAGYPEDMYVALRAVPIVSLSMSVDDMFGSGGVYSNPDVYGLEKAVSVEWITNGVGQVQLDAGLRVQGGASRIFSRSPKKSLRLLFKAEYGPGRLKTPVLKDHGTDLGDFNTLILRADYNNSWIHGDYWQRLRGTYIRDQWVRDTQFEMSGTASHGGHVHLFLNGIYWGLYNPSERPDAAFGANYFGGERADYDAMTHSGIRDGDNIAWNQMINVAKGDLTTETQYELMKQYLNIDHLIDYMIVNIYGGNADWPHNNWNAIRRREAGAGYLFYCWDSERTLESTNINITGVTGALDSRANSASFYNALRVSEEFRLRFADRLHKHFFNGGALVPERAAERLESRINKTEIAVYGESVRWGAYRNETYNTGLSYTTTHWINECDRILDSYFPVRSDIVLSQFHSANLYPDTDAPEFSQHGGVLDYGEDLSITAPSGVIYVTVDGVDPRVVYTSAVYSNTFEYITPLDMTNAVTLKARALYNGEWSALTEAEFGVYFTEALFLPSVDGSWHVAGNWNGNVVPEGAGQRVCIQTPAEDRDVELYAPVTIGGIRFDNSTNAYRNRVRDQASGNTLTFQNTAGSNAFVRVEGSGSGYAELKVEAGVILQSDLELDIQNLEGYEGYGALRLRESWSGIGDVIKSGAGVAAFTGDNKNFSGSVEILEGVLSFTASSAPAYVDQILVASGGQLRLSSSSAPGELRLYPFGGTLHLSGMGRGEDIPDNDNRGKLGALRCEPEDPGSALLLTNQILLADDVDIHVAGEENRLQITGALKGSHKLSKSGGGTLLLCGVMSGFSGGLEVLNGSVGVDHQPATFAAISGSGRFVIDSSIINAVLIDGAALDLIFNKAGAPDYTMPHNCGNALLRLDSAIAVPSEIRMFLQEKNDARGGIFVPYVEDLAVLLESAGCQVYLRDLNGTTLFQGEQWSLNTNAQVVAVEEMADFGGGAVEGKIISVYFGAEPLSYEAWKTAVFESVADQNNPLVAGPLAAPFDDDVSNLMRYALGVTNSIVDVGLFHPRLTLNASGAEYRFPFKSARDDLRYVVESTADLEIWEGAELLYDSLTDYPANLLDGWMTLDDPVLYPQRFFRLRVILR